MVYENKTETMEKWHIQLHHHNYLDYFSIITRSELQLDRLRLKLDRVCIQRLVLFTYKFIAWGDEVAIQASVLN